MKRISFRWSIKQWILCISFFASLILALGLQLFSGYLKNQLTHEMVADQWDKEGGTAHISVYFSESEKYGLKDSLDATAFRLENWYQQILKELENASITVDTEQNPTARLAVYGYSASGKIQLNTEHGNAEVKAYGVGGDFFQFHPLKLVYGSYFSESDLMQDRIVIDTETAWKLFGSNDVVGMFVKIDGIPHMVVGVYERESGHFNDAAGNDESCAYVSHSTLYEHGQYHGLETAEYLIPNPVSGFAAGLVQTQYSGMDVEIVENQKRYDFLPLLNVIRAFGTRSMGLSGITFPYWENIARGYEDVLAGLLLLELICLTYALVVLVCFVWYLWLHRKWRARNVYEKIKDLGYEASVKSYRRREKAKVKKKAAKSDQELVFEEFDLEDADQE